MSAPLQWPYRKRLTCSVWAFGQWLLYGGKIKIIRSPKVRWLFRVLWSPDGEVWFGYVPIKPVLSPWHATLKNSLWFEGKIRRERDTGAP